MTHKISVVFKNSYHKNKIKWYSHDGLEYGKLYEGCDDGIHIISRDNIKVCDIELSIFLTPGKGKHISFINGYNTKDGGVHVNKLYNSIYTHVLKYMQNILKYNINKNSILEKIIKENITIFMSCWEKNHTFHAINKPELFKYSDLPEIIFNKQQVEILAKWLISVFGDDNDYKNNNKTTENKTIKNKIKDKSLVSRVWKKIW